MVWRKTFARGRNAPVRVNERRQVLLCQDLLEELAEVNARVARATSLFAAGVDDGVDISRDTARRRRKKRGSLLVRKLAFSSRKGWISAARDAKIDHAKRLIANMPDPEARDFLMNMLDKYIRRGQLLDSVNRQQEEQNLNEVIDWMQTDLSDLKSVLHFNIDEVMTANKDFRAIYMDNMKTVAKLRKLRDKMDNEIIVQRDLAKRMRRRRSMKRGGDKFFGADGRKKKDGGYYQSSSGDSTSVQSLDDDEECPIKELSSMISALMPKFSEAQAKEANLQLEAIEQRVQHTENSYKILRKTILNTEMEIRKLVYNETLLQRENSKLRSRLQQMDQKKKETEYVEKGSQTVADIWDKGVRFLSTSAFCDVQEIPLSFSQSMEISQHPDDVNELATVFRDGIWDFTLSVKNEIQDIIKNLLSLKKEAREDLKAENVMDRWLTMIKSKFQEAIRKVKGKIPTTSTEDESLTLLTRVPGNHACEFCLCHNVREQVVELSTKDIPLKMRNREAHCGCYLIAMATAESLFAQTFSSVYRMHEHSKIFWSDPVFDDIYKWGGAPVDLNTDIREYEKQNKMLKTKPKQMEDLVSQAFQAIKASLNYSKEFVQTLDLNKKTLTESPVKENAFDRLQKLQRCAKQLIQESDLETITERSHKLQIQQMLEGSVCPYCNCYNQTVDVVSRLPLSKDFASANTMQQGLSAMSKSLHKVYYSSREMLDSGQFEKEEIKSLLSSSVSTLSNSLKTVDDYLRRQTSKLILEDQAHWMFLSASTSDWGSQMSISPSSSGYGRKSFKGMQLKSNRSLHQMLLSADFIKHEQAVFQPSSLIRDVFHKWKQYAKSRRLGDVATLTKSTSLAKQVKSIERRLLRKAMKAREQEQARREASDKDQERDQVSGTTKPRKKPKSAIKPDEDQDKGQQEASVSQDKSYSDSESTEPGQEEITADTTVRGRIGRRSRKVAHGMKFSIKFDEAAKESSDKIPHIKTRVTAAEGVAAVARKSAVRVMLHERQTAKPRLGRRGTDTDTSELITKLTEEIALSVSEEALEKKASEEERILVEDYLKVEEIILVEDDLKVKWYAVDAEETEDLEKTEVSCLTDAETRDVEYIKDSDKTEAEDLQESEITDVKDHLIDAVKERAEDHPKDVGKSTSKVHMKAAEIGEGVQAIQIHRKAKPLKEQPTRIQLQGKKKGLISRQAIDIHEEAASISAITQKERAYSEEVLSEVMSIRNYWIPSRSLEQTITLKEMVSEPSSLPEPEISSQVFTQSVPEISSQVSSQRPPPRKVSLEKVIRRKRGIESMVRSDKEFKDRNLTDFLKIGKVTSKPADRQDIKVAQAKLYAFGKGGAVSKPIMSVKTPKSKMSADHAASGIFVISGARPIELGTTITPDPCLHRGDKVSLHRPKGIETSETIDSGLPLDSQLLSPIEYGPAVRTYFQLRRTSQLGKGIGLRKQYPLAVEEMSMISAAKMTVKKRSYAQPLKEKKRKVKENIKEGARAADKTHDIDQWMLFDDTDTDMSEPQLQPAETNERAIPLKPRTPPHTRRIIEDTMTKKPEVIPNWMQLDEAAVTAVPVSLRKPPVKYTKLHDRRVQLQPQLQRGKDELPVRKTDLHDHKVQLEQQLHPWKDDLPVKITKLHDRSMWKKTELQPGEDEFSVKETDLEDHKVWTEPELQPGEDEFPVKETDLEDHKVWTEPELKPGEDEFPVKETDLEDHKVWTEPELQLGEDEFPVKETDLEDHKVWTEPELQPGEDEFPVKETDLEDRKVWTEPELQLEEDELLIGGFEKTEFARTAGPDTKMKKKGRSKLFIFCPDKKLVEKELSALCLTTAGLKEYKTKPRKARIEPQGLNIVRRSIDEYRKYRTPVDLTSHTKFGAQRPRTPAEMSHDIELRKSLQDDYCGMASVDMKKAQLLARLKVNTIPDVASSLQLRRRKNKSVTLIHWIFDSHVFVTPSEWILSEAEEVTRSQKLSTRLSVLGECPRMGSGFVNPMKTRASKPVKFERVHTQFTIGPQTIPAKTRTYISSTPKNIEVETTSPVQKMVDYLQRRLRARQAVVEPIPSVTDEGTRILQLQGTRCPAPAPLSTEQPAPLQAHDEQPKSPAPQKTSPPPSVAARQHSRPFYGASKVHLYRSEDMPSSPFCRNVDDDEWLTHSLIPTEVYQIKPNFECIASKAGLHRLAQTEVTAMLDHSPKRDQTDVGTVNMPEICPRMKRMKAERLKGLKAQETTRLKSSAAPSGPKPPCFYVESPFNQRFFFEDKRNLFPSKTRGTYKDDYVVPTPPRERSYSGAKSSSPKQQRDPLQQYQQLQHIQRGGHSSRIRRGRGWRLGPFSIPSLPAKKVQPAVQPVTVSGRRVVVQRPEMLQHVREGQRLMQSRISKDKKKLNATMLANILDYEIPGMKGTQAYTRLLEMQDSVDSSA